jgi:hypothetical protein
MTNTQESIQAALSAAARPWLSGGNAGQSQASSNAAAAAAGEDAENNNTTTSASTAGVTQPAARKGRLTYDEVYRLGPAYTDAQVIAAIEAKHVAAAGRQKQKDQASSRRQAKAAARQQAEEEYRTLLGQYEISQKLRYRLAVWLQHVLASARERMEREYTRLCEEAAR